MDTDKHQRQHEEEMVVTMAEEHGPEETMPEQEGTKGTEPVTDAQPTEDAPESQEPSPEEKERLETLRRRQEAVTNTTQDYGENPVSNALTALVNGMDRASLVAGRLTVTVGKGVQRSTHNIPVVGSVVRIGQVVTDVGAGLWSTLKESLNDANNLSNAVGQRHGITGRTSNLQAWRESEAYKNLAQQSYDMKADEPWYERFASEGVLGAFDRAATTTSAGKIGTRGVYSHTDEIARNFYSSIRGEMPTPADATQQTQKTQQTTDAQQQTQKTASDVAQASSQATKATPEPEAETKADEPAMSRVDKTKLGYVATGVATGAGSVFLLGNPIGLSVAAGAGVYVAAKSIHKSYLAAKAAGHETFVTKSAEKLSSRLAQVRGAFHDNLQNVAETAKTAKAEYDTAAAKTRKEPNVPDTPQTGTDLALA